MSYLVWREDAEAAAGSAMKEQPAIGYPGPDDLGEGFSRLLGVGESDHALLKAGAGDALRKAV